VQGPGRAGGTGRILLAFLDGRLRVFVPTYVSLVDIDDCIAGHLLAAERGLAGERYLVNGMSLELTEALALAADVAGVQRKPRLLPARVATVAAAAVERGFRVAGRRPPVCREMVRTLLHGHRYDGSRAEHELGLTYTDPRETLRKTVAWARAEGLIR
jgi:dihydroflavonol-4-reductase